LLLSVDAFSLHEILLVGAASDTELLLLGEDGAVVLAVLVHLSGRFQLWGLSPLRLLLGRFALIEVVYQLIPKFLILRLAWIIQRIVGERPG